MTDENWDKVREIFDSALRRKPEERWEFIREACRDDKNLLAEVESLLTSHDSAANFMETPAVAQVADAIGGKSKKLEKGNILGHYEIVEPLGTGGMGEVYLAKDQILDRQVAVKILNEEFSNDESSLSRFIREAQAASALNHPNILVIHEIGACEDAHFIVSEYINGKTLREVFIEKTLSLSEVLDVSIQIANALGAAHDARLIHRDIKPENIMIRPDGFVKVLDFGLAKLVEQKNKSILGLDESTFEKNQTAKGMIMGTVNYMSPEQAKGEVVDERTDIFSLGVVMYEMIAGKTPFTGSSMVETLANLMNAEPQLLSSFAANLPDELSGIVSKMLCKNKEERYQTAKALLIDLKNAHQNLEVQDKLLIIAVLPFANESGNADVEYLSEELTETLINSLSQLSNLNVKARSSVFRYKGKTTDVQTIGKELNVQAILNGRIVQRGEQLMLTLELVDGQSENVIWSGQYNCEQTDLISLQSEIARDVSQKLKTKLSGADEARVTKNYTANPEAYKFYLLGRFFWNKRTAENIRKAIEQFKAAAEKDPGYALAYAGLADCYAISQEYLRTPSSEALPQAKAYANRALEIDDSLGEAHATLGLINRSLWNWAEAEKEFKRAIELNPNYPTAHHWYCRFLRAMGRTDEALAEIKLANELDPLSPVILGNLGHVYLELGEVDAAFEQYRKAIELYPNNPGLHNSLSYVYLKQGRTAEALAEAKTAVELSNRANGHLSLLGYVYAVSGYQNEALAIVKELEEKYPKHQADGIDIAGIYTGLGNKGQAFEWIEKQFQKRSSQLTAVKTEPVFEHLRSDPRYRDLLRRMNLPVDLQHTVSNVLRNDKDARFQAMKGPLTELRDLKENLTFDEKLERSGSLGNHPTQAMKATTGDAVFHTTHQLPSVSIRRAAPVGIIIILAAAVFFGVKLWQPRSTGTASGQISEKRITVEGGATRAVISQDGHYAAVVQNAALRLFDLQKGSERILVPASKDIRITTVAFRPDGGVIYFGSRQMDGTVVSLFGIPVDGGEPVKILEDIYGAVSFSPDNKRVAFVRRYPEMNEFALLYAEADGSNINRLASSRLPNRFDGTLAWSPDGSKIACVTVSVEGGFHYTIAKVDVSTGSVDFVPDKRWTNINSIVWLADSQRVILAGQDEKSVNLQVWRFDTNTGESSPVTNDLFVYESISGTTDGRSIVAVKVRQSSHVWMLGDQQIQLTGGFDNYDGVSGLAWSTDGNIFYHSRASGRDAIWRMQIDGSQATEITPDTAGGFAVSPDGEILVFQGKQSEDHLGLQLMNISDGSQRSLTENVTAMAPAFFPDGTRLVFSLYDKKLAIFEVSVNKGQPTVLNDEYRAAMEPVVSPSGRFIAFVFNRTQQGKTEDGIAVVADESKQIVSSHPVKVTTGSRYEEPAIQWSADESEIYFIQIDNSVSNIMKLRLSDGTVSKVTNFADGRIFNFAVEPGGKRMLIARGLVERDATLLQFDQPM